MAAISKCQTFRLNVFFSSFKQDQLYICLLRTIFQQNLDVFWPIESQTHINVIGFIISMAAALDNVLRHKQK